MSKFKVGDKVRSLTYMPWSKGEVVDLSGGSSLEFPIGVKLEGASVTHYFKEEELELTKHLWEVEHEYYGADTNGYMPLKDSDYYFKTWGSWDAFTNSEDFAMVEDKPNLNLLYRWDWVKGREDQYPEEEHLKLFWIQPRRGTIGADTILVSADDEPQVREFLERRAERMKKMWEPLI